jgi:uncharacterized membrane protein (DUF2068 family)
MSGDEWLTEPARKEVPAGVAALTIVLIFSGISLMMGFPAASYSLSFVPVVLGIVMVAAAWGLARMEKWAWFVTLAVLGTNLLLLFLILPLLGDQVWFGVLSVVACIGAVLYLLLPKIRLQFGVKPSRQGLHNKGH